MTYRIIDNDAERVFDFVNKEIGSIYYPAEGCAVGLEKNGKLIAGTIYHLYNGGSLCMHTAAIAPLNKEYIWFCFYYPFEQLGVKVLIGLVESTNLKAIDFNYRLGFKHEHTIIDGAPDGDTLVLTMRKEHCKWLRVKT